MLFADFWDVVLSLNFLVTFGLVMLPFLGVAASIVIIWEQNRDHAKRVVKEMEAKRK
ncbi:MAG: hypothetical protein GYB68_02260 [Chloroflexi bacterium]|nr:hypothetical protein [Chloroflexota bacterium]